MTGLVRVILIGIIVGFVWSWFKRLSRKRLEQQKSRSSDPGKTDNSKTDKMLPCAECGLYVPAKEAVKGSLTDQTQVFCCEEHRQRHQEINE